MILRRLFIFTFSFLVLISCSSDLPEITTVTGGIPLKKMGKTLVHEHLLVDFIGADSTGYHRWNKDEVIEKVLPYLIEIKKLNYKTLVDCTPAYLGRDVELLKTLSEKSGVQIITNTGYYSAYNGKFLPQHAFTETAQEIAARWIDEAKNGIEGTSVYPGFIKISVERAPLQDINRKIVEAACITHLETGLTIMSHTGPAEPAFEQLEILQQYGIDPSAFIWTHASDERDINQLLKAAKMGAFISWDKFKPEDAERYVEFFLFMKKHAVLHTLLFSHDAGWYKPGEPDGGDFRGFTDIENYLIPALENAGVAQYDIFQVFFKNPVEAFRIKKRLINEEE
ncbi:phosphotriesterase family protein [Maribellus sediminis]|uniref:phosphotriesterase family protein n=1 Tax=Maribellus sediminis TaxID=2696285 RepID=UPI00143022F3|nr:phosphotriesterase [Maribellus sediminis]